MMSQPTLIAMSDLNGLLPSRSSVPVTRSDVAQFTVDLVIPNEVVDPERQEHECERDERVTDLPANVEHDSPLRAMERGNPSLGKRTIDEVAPETSYGIHVVPPRLAVSYVHPRSLATRNRYGLPPRVPRPTCRSDAYRRHYRRKCFPDLASTGNAQTLALRHSRDSPSPIPTGGYPPLAGPRSSADRATDFESVRGGSTPPGAIVRRRRDVRRGAQAVAPRRTSPLIATRPSERTGDVARRIPGARSRRGGNYRRSLRSSQARRPSWLSRRERCARSAGRPIPSPAPRVIRCGPGAPAVRPSVCEVASARGRAGRPWARRFLRVARPRRRHPTERHHLCVSVRICFHEAGWPVS